MDKLRDTVVIYHSNCPDGFGSAFAAWKKFGDSASYVPASHQAPYPEGLEGKDVYIVDFSYPDGKLLEIEKIANKLVVLDHHEGAKEWITEVKEHVYDDKKSGATISWTYFHPEIETPELFKYIEDDDLYKFELPDSRAIVAYIHSKDQNFKVWDETLEELETEDGREKIIEVGKIYREHFSMLANNTADSAKLVLFEGYECYLVPAHSIFASDVGATLAKRKPPISLVTRARVENVAVSLRSDGTVDVSEIAKKYGGGGHPASAGFRIPYNEPMPWKSIKENEDTSN